MQILQLAALLVVLALLSPARAEPPFVNTAFPPAGFVVPREDPAFPRDPVPYPEHATECKESGMAKVALTIAADGRVTDAAIAQSTGFSDLDAAIVVQARKWRYFPATKDGAPTAVRVAITIPLAPEKHVPKFAADCARRGSEAAAEELLRQPGGSPQRN